MEMKIGSAIRRFRTMTELTRAQLAQKIGITDAQLAHYEANRVIPSIQVLRRMADVFKEVLGPSALFIKQIEESNEKTEILPAIAEKES